MLGINYPFTPYWQLCWVVSTDKDSFFLQQQNKAPNPNRPYIILKAEIVSFNVISTRFDSL